ncbi:MAG: hypothetical protein SPL13_00650, partial [Clostridia bacterium]|nr:hypothetical protein [Clostridia bacterium]
SANLTNAINTVVNRIVAAGESINLVQESQLDQTTGAPYLSTTQIHVKSEIALSTKTGITFVVNPTYEGDAKIYKNTVVVEGIELPLATNLIVTKNDNTELYYKFGESSTWTKINVQNGRPLREALVNNASGIYTIREYGDSGVCEFKIYYDRTLPLLELTINNEPLTLDGTELNLSGATTTFTSLKNEVDDLAYIAIYTYPTRELLTVLYKADVPNYSLDSGNYYVQVGDRAGNVVTYTLLLSSSTLEVTATENESKTAVVVRVNSRDDSEIYTYEVYLNEELITNEFAAVRSFKEPGLYRINVTDIYGNFYTKTVEHNYQSPKITWYYLNDMDSYSKYDESRTSKMIVSNDLNNVRVTNVYTSTLIRLQFDLASANSEIKFEMQGIDSGFYTYSSSTGVLSVNTLYDWTLRVWYEDHPENDHVYICQIDTNAPSFDASFIGKVFSLSYDPERLTQEELASIGEGNSILPTSIGYTADNKSATYSLYNGSVIEGNHISIKMFDRSDIKSYSVTRNGQSIDMSLDASGALLINSYGVYEITATDKLGNTSTFSFVNTKEAVSSATMGEDNLKRDTTAMGHEPLVVKTKYSGNTTILIQTIDGKNDCYVFNFDGNTVTYGSYFVGSESDLDETDIKLYFAEFITASGFSLSLSGDGVRQNRWYSVVDNDYYTVSVMFDAQSCAVYKVDCKQKEFTVSVLASVGNGKIPDYYTAKMSQEKTDISIYADEFELEIDKNSDYTYVAGVLTLAQSGISDKYPTVVKIEVAFSETPSFNNYVVVYQAVYKSESEGYTVSFDGFTGEDDGYYQFVIYNVFGNVTTYTICKVESFTTIVTARYQDEGHNEYLDVLDRIIRSNKEISLLVFSDNVHFIVNGETYEGVKVGATTELVLNMPGRYEVRVVAANGIYKEFEFEIGTDYEFSFVEEWLTGYNEKALLKEQGYTNNRLTVQLTDSVKYVEVVYNDQTKTVVYDELSGETINDPELLENAIGKSGNGVYVVNFRDKYGDVVSKTIHFSTLPQISISRRTLNSQNVWNSYSYGQAVIGIYSNYQIRFETSSHLYEFKINDNIVSLEEPRIIEFGNTGGNGRFEYKISFTDEYGNMLLTRAILMRADVQIDKPQMKEVFVDGVRYTKDNVAITFARGLTASVSVGGGEPVKYTSGTTFYKDGNYTFIIEDVAGNRLEYTIVHKSVNNFTLTDRTTELPIILGSVINNSAVIFRTTDNSSIKTLVKNGKLISDYDSNVFSSTGHYEMLIEDLIGNQAYAEFYILNNSIGEFEYFAPYGYEIKEVWKADGSENSKLIETDDDYILLDQNGDYVVLVAGKEILSSFRFTVTVDNTPPTAVLEGVENGGTTARNVSIKGLKVG